MLKNQLFVIIIDTFIKIVQKENIIDGIEFLIEIDDSEFESTYTYKGKWITTIIILTHLIWVSFLLLKNTKHKQLNNSTLS